MMKRLLYILLSLMLITSISFGNVIDNSADVLVKMGILNGYPDGTLKLENNITRAEFCSLIIRMVGKNQVPLTNKFSDIKESHWAYGVINRAAELGYLRGYEDGTFRPSNNITYAESCSILINMLGYKDEVVGEWPTNVTEKAKELGISKNLEELEASYTMTRGEISVMLVNSMHVNFKGDVNAQDGI